MARVFWAGRRERSWAVYSVATPILTLVAAAAVGGETTMGLSQRTTLILFAAWMVAVAAHLLRSNMRSRTAISE
jgi:hypothetical protein